MPDALKVEFQITLNDWLEFRTAELSTFRLWVLRLAERLSRPLVVLLVLSILVVAARLSGLVHVAIPNWLPIPILGLMAASQIYLSLPNISATRKARNEWKQRIANVAYTMELTNEGFHYFIGLSLIDIKWFEVDSVFQSEHVLMFCDEDNESCVLIPKRSFPSETQMREFLEIAYQKTVVERGFHKD
ncbi:MAG TPA: hypothetical protein VFZ22_00925 [Pyrinomonadaceae bacterium]|nr:hypothetical protein [Pyrinomonadaceae bacterium]